MDNLPYPKGMVSQSGSLQTWLIHLEINWRKKIKTIEEKPANVSKMISQVIQTTKLKNPN